MNVMIKRNVSMVFATLWLAACAVSYAPQSRPMLPENQVVWLQVEELDHTGGVQQTTLLSVQGMADGNTRWLQTDSLGAPKARLLATDKGWKNDGFAPPNRRAQKLFGQIFSLLNQDLTAPHTVVSDGTAWRVQKIEMPE